MQKSKLVNIVDYIGQLPGYENIPAIVQNINALRVRKENSIQFYNIRFHYGKEGAFFGFTRVDPSAKRKNRNKQCIQWQKHETFDFLGKRQP